MSRFTLTNPDQNPILNRQKIGSHFDRAASKYLTSSISRFVKKIEINAILSSLPLSLQGLSILDIGCGSGYLIENLLKRNPQFIRGIDQSAPMLRRIPRDSRIDLLREDFPRLKVDQQYDLVFLCGVLEFSDNPRHFLQQALSWVAPNGQFIILYPPHNQVGRIYQWYHLLLHQISIQLFSPNQIREWIDRDNWKLKTQTRIHAYAQMEIYERK